jgi:diaminopimelate epimerase
MRGMSDRAKISRYELVRSHGLGNDYLIVDGERFGIPLQEAAIRAICNRHTGVGSDGILVRSPPPAGFDTAVRIFNPDGSEAEKSGNGVRIFAKFCFDDGYADREHPLRIHTLGGEVTARWLKQEGGRTFLRVSMGRASFRCADLPMRGPDGGPDEGPDEWIERPLVVGDRRFSVTCLSVGNPHAVVLDAPFEEELAKTYGPLIENHVRFPRRTNVQFVRVRDRHTVEALIWERGAGWTLSSGSSACAVAAACRKAGLVDSEVAVVMPGGTLAVTVYDDYRLDQVGFAEEVARLRLSENFLSGLATI